MNSFENYLKARMLSENNYYVDSNKVLDTENKFEPLAIIDNSSRDRIYVVRFTQSILDKNLEDKELEKLIKVLINNIAESLERKFKFAPENHPQNLNNIITKLVREKYLIDHGGIFYVDFGGDNEEDHYLVPNLVKAANDAKDFEPNQNLNVAGLRIEQVFDSWLQSAGKSYKNAEQNPTVTKRFEEEFKKEGNSPKVPDQEPPLATYGLRYWENTMKRYNQPWRELEDYLFKSVWKSLNQNGVPDKNYDWELQNFRSYYEVIPFESGKRLIQLIAQRFTQDEESLRRSFELGSIFRFDPLAKEFMKNIKKDRSKYNLWTKITHGN